MLDRITVSTAKGDTCSNPAVGAFFFNKISRIFRLVDEIKLLFGFIKFETKNDIMRGKLFYEGSINLWRFSKRS